MTRKSKTDKIDLSIPVDLNTELISNDDDCFGKLWENTNKLCVVCSMYALCMVYRFKTDKNNEIYLDNLDWDSVPWDDLENEIKGNFTPFNELVSIVMSSSRCMDKYTAECKVNNFLKEKNLTSWIIY